VLSCVPARATMKPIRFPNIEEEEVSQSQIGGSLDSSAEVSPPSRQGKLQLSRLGSFQIYESEGLLAGEKLLKTTHQGVVVQLEGDGDLLRRGLLSLSNYRLFLSQVVGGHHPQGEKGEVKRIYIKLLISCTQNEGGCYWIPYNNILKWKMSPERIIVDCKDFRHFSLPSTCCA